MEQLFLTGTVMHVKCNAKHQWDHLTDSDGNTQKHLAKNSRHLASISFSAPCGTIEGGETPVPTFAPTDRYGLLGFN